MSEDKQNLLAYRQRTNAIVQALKADLAIWIDRHGGSDRQPTDENDESGRYFVEVTSALLEMAIDRQLDLLGITDALDLITRCFNRRADRYRQSLQ